MSSSHCIALLVLVLAHAASAHVLSQRSVASDDATLALQLARQMHAQIPHVSAQSRAAPSFTGFNLENCTATGPRSQCVAPRLCQKGKIPKGCRITDRDCLACEPGDTDCFCVNPDPETSRCECADPTCDAGEFCATPFLFSTANSLCISVLEWMYFDQIRCECVNQEKCFNDRDSCTCVGDRVCGVENDGEPFSECTFKDVGKCTCINQNKEERMCSCEDACTHPEEVCVVEREAFEQDPTLRDGECFSTFALDTKFNQKKFMILDCPTPEPTFVPRPTNPKPSSPTPKVSPLPSRSPAASFQPPSGTNTDRSADSCIDVALLGDFDSRQLVFAEHRSRNVLCDAQGSCATRGHMVHYQGAAMMMGSYCDLVGGCVRETRLVNSPRYRRAMRVASRTEGLAFTALAARYETRSEEAVLSAAVRMGL